MTTGRQKRKRYGEGHAPRSAWSFPLSLSSSFASWLAAGAGFAVYAGLAFVLAVSVPASRADANEQVVVDWRTGLAISGYDPVAFFTDGKPVEGSPDFELRYGGAIWRFANIGNRAAFAARPDIYMPQYGGHDPLGVARGLAVAGNPNAWLIASSRLFLFYNDERREKFVADPNRVIVPADRKWTDVQRTLTP
jgi:hypothetical protein